MKFDTTDDNARELLVYSFTGDEAKAKAARENDEPITLNLTAADVKELQRRAREQPMSHMGLGGLLSDYDGNPVDPLMAVRNMAISPAYNEFRLAESYFGVFMDGDKKPLPGELTIG